MRKLLLPVLLLITLSSSAQRLLTVEEAIATALQNNYNILLAKNDSAVFALDYSYRNAAFLPRINGNLGTVWNNNDQKQILADDTKRESKGLKSNNVNAQLALNWTLFDGLKMFATRDKLEEFVRLGELGVKNQLVNTVATVINTYYNIVRQKQQLKAVEEQMALSQERVKLAQYKLDIGVGTKPDVLQGKVDLNAQRAAQIQQQTLIAKLKEDLNQLMNVKQSTLYDVTDSIPINTLLSMGDIQSTMEANNPALLIAKKNIDIAGLVLKERKADRFPTVSFNSAYNFNRTNNQAVINSFSTLFNRTKGFNYGLTATIPILNNFNTKRLIKQAQLDIQYQRIVYDNQKSLLNLSLINAYKDYEQQKRALALEEESILLAKENVDILFQVYRLNSTTL
ncbi:MAG TPA: TolC family protein, partial [Chitinophagaceae bacterium]|nr:TolC family protein [Chitinophagaceae bacterium]